MSDDGRFGLTIIGFVGSVFSPYYLSSGRGHPVDHSAINVALYGPHGNRWTMTERGANSVSRDPGTLEVGPSAMRWDGNALVIDIEERCAVLPFNVRGRVRVIPEVINTVPFALDPAGKHHWRVVAPRARVEVTMDKPGLSWSGTAYWDSNEGSEPLEAGFRDWQWSRAHLGHEVAVLYEGVRNDRSRFAAALRFDRSGVPHEEELPQPASLPRTAWLMPRRTRSDDGHARVLRTWEDTPFYSRSTLAVKMFGERVAAVHESLSLDRLVTPVVQWMLPYRMPRVTT
ncbi:MAG: carotenoid 1,2-hydratase [Alphaproteobacteria bacterium]|nr:carotenoid 1,2-hydratase [Alphaproteobacteria bacterium]